MTSTNPAPTIEDVAVLDTRALDDLVSATSSARVVRDILETFVAHLAERLHLLGLGVAAGNLGDVRSAALAIASPAQMIGAHTLAESILEVLAAVAVAAKPDLATLDRARAQAVVTEAGIRVYLETGPREHPRDSDSNPALGWRRRGGRPRARSDQPTAEPGPSSAIAARSARTSSSDV